MAISRDTRQLILRRIKEINEEVANLQRDNAPKEKELQDKLDRVNAVNERIADLNAEKDNLTSDIR